MATPFRRGVELDICGDAKYAWGVGFVADRVAVDVAAEVLSNDRVGYRAGFRIR